MNGDPRSIIDLVAAGTLDARLGALLWLLVEGGVPLVVSGPMDATTRGSVADALLALPPSGAAVLVDVDAERPGLASLGARISGGTRVALTLAATDLRDTISRLSAPPDGLPDDAVRRLGLVLIVGEAASVTPGPVRMRVRILAAHYLRPLERDAQGHVQRRPPAVLATWRPDDDTFDDFAWGLTPELADLVDRTQASFEELQSGRAAALRSLAARPAAERGDPGQALRAVMAGEPPRRPAPARPSAASSRVHNPLTDPHVH